MLATRLKGGGVTNTPVYVDDVFSTFLYSGTGATQSINNGINLSANGGLVWLKQRSGAVDHFWFDTARGVNNEINSNTNAGQATLANSLTAFNTNGFTLGSATEVNASGQAYVGWTFRECPKFFDVVTYTGNGNNRAITHNLGSVPACIMIKRTTAGTNTTWVVYHRGITNASTNYLRLDGTNSVTFSEGIFDSTAPTATQFFVGSDTLVNASNNTYVAYLFAHDAGGFGQSGTQNAISCGSYAGIGSSNGPEINLGFEPQWVMIKSSSVTGTNWVVFDNTRGSTFTTGTSSLLIPNNSDAETVVNNIRFTPIGFRLQSTASTINSAEEDYVYIAIRRSNKPPSSGTEVFTPFVYTGTNVDNRLVNAGQFSDFILARQRNTTLVAGMVAGFRNVLGYLLTGSTNGINTDADSLMSPVRVSTVDYGNSFSTMTGFGVGNDATSSLNASTVANNQIAECFKRSVGFHDVVAYSGTGSVQTLNHNLQAVPELMIVKSFSSAVNWVAYYGNATTAIVLNSNILPATSSATWNNTSPTDTVFTVGTAATTNSSGQSYIALLFATLAGISKVGTYTGNGSSQTIDCGFTTGARFILIKRLTGANGDWYIWDTARGITATNDPHLALNQSNPETTTFDTVDPDNSGFIVVQNTTTNINVSGSSYLFFAVA